MSNSTCQDLNSFYIAMLSLNHRRRGLEICSKVPVTSSAFSWCVVIFVATGVAREISSYGLALKTSQTKMLKKVGLS